MALNVYFNRHNGPNGKWRAEFRYKGQRPTKVVKTKKEGREWAEQKAEEIDRTEALANALTYSLASSEYLEDCVARNMQSGTVNEKLSIAKSFAEWSVPYLRKQGQLGKREKDFPVEVINLESVRRYYRYVCNTKTIKTANRHVKHLKAMWNFHIKENRLAYNPWSQVNKTKADKDPKYIPPEEDVIAILLAAEPWQQDYLQVILKTGCRPGEPSRILWEHVNFEHEQLWLWTRKRDGSGKEFDPIPMPKGSGLYVLLKRRWEERDRESPYVFTNPRTRTGYSRQSDGIKYMLKDKHHRRRKHEITRWGLCSKAGVKPFTLYALRHFTAQRMADSGKVSLTGIQAMMRHKRATTTNEYLEGIRGKAHVGATFLEENDLLNKAQARRESTEGTANVANGNVFRLR